jgi:hypothetical protein
LLRRLSLDSCKLPTLWLAESTPELQLWQRRHSGVVGLRLLRCLLSLADSVCSYCVLQALYILLLVGAAFSSVNSQVSPTVPSTAYNSPAAGVTATYTASSNGTATTFSFAVVRPRAGSHALLLSLLLLFYCGVSDLRISRWVSVHTPLLVVHDATCMRFVHLALCGPCRQTHPFRLIR